MRNLLTILSLFFCLQIVQAQTPTANAGSDLTIYLTSTNQVSLSGSGTNISSVKWREVSTDYSSGATITNSNSLSTTVTGLPQGVFYFELAITSPTDIVAVDTIKITVNFSTAPGVLMRSIAEQYVHIIDTVNNRRDTSHTLDQEKNGLTFEDGLGTEVFLDRSRTNGEFIDAQLGKFYSILEDGYGWNLNDYARCEMSFGSGYTFDSTKTYCMEWKGYFPQNWSTLKLNQDAAIFMQIHGNSGVQNLLGTQVVNQGSGAKFVINDNGTYHIICGLDSFVNKTHTVRVTFKEGGASNGSFYKVEVDGVQYYLKTSGLVWGTPANQDYPKIATLYDYGRALVSPDSLSRGRKFSMVTEGFNIYNVSTPIAAPTIIMGGNQSITVDHTSVSATATWASSHTGTYSWSKVSGPGATSFGSPSSSSTTVTGLQNGDYVIRCTLLQDDSQTTHGDISIHVAIPPVITPGSSIILHTKTVYVNK